MPNLSLTETDRRQLESLTQRNKESKATRRARVLLALDRGEKPAKVAAQFGVTRSTVYEWVQRYFRRKHLDLPQRLRDLPRPGRPQTIRQKVKAVLPNLIKSPPDHYGYEARVWTIGLLKQHLANKNRLAVSRETVRRAMIDLHGKEDQS